MGEYDFLFSFLSTSGNKKISNDNVSYHWLNFLGATGFGINAFFGKVGAIVFAEIVWTIIAIASVIRIYIKIKKGSS